MIEARNFNLSHLFQRNAKQEAKGNVKAFRTLSVHISTETSRASAYLAGLGIQRKLRDREANDP